MKSPTNRIQIGDEWSKIYQKYYSSYKFIHSFYVEKTNMAQGIKGVLEICDNLGIRHTKNIFEVMDGRSKILIWIIGFSRPQEQVYDKERILFDDNFDGISKISEQRRFRVDQKRLMFTLKNELIITNYTSEREPPNHQFYNKSLLISFRDNFSFNATLQILSNFDLSAFNIKIGFSHCKRILKVPNNSSSNSGIIVYFNDHYKLVYDSIKRLNTQIQILMVDHPTNQINLSNSRTSPQSFISYAQYLEPNMQLNHWQDLRASVKSPQYESYIISSNKMIDLAHTMLHISEDEKDLLQSVRYVQGVDQDFPQRYPYSIMVQADSIKDIDNLEIIATNTNTFQMFSDQQIIKNKIGRVYKNYEIYRHPQLFQISALENKIPVKYQFMTTKLVISGSTTKDRSFLQSLCLTNNIKAKIFGNFQQVAIVNSLDEAKILFRVIVQNTKFSVVFIEDYRSVFGAKEDKEKKLEELTAIDDTDEYASEETSQNSGTISLSPQGIVTISSKDKNDALKMLQYLWKEDKLSVSLQKTDEQTKDNEFKFNDGQIIISGDNLQKKWENINTCKMSKSIRIELV